MLQNWNRWAGIRLAQAQVSGGFVVIWTYEMKGSNDSLEGNKIFLLDFRASSDFRNKKGIGKSAV